MVEKVFYQVPRDYGEYDAAEESDSVCSRRSSLTQRDPSDCELQGASGLTVDYVKEMAKQDE